MSDRRVLVGRFGAPHGVRGEVRLQSFTEDPAAIGNYRPLSDASGQRQFAIKSLRHVKDNVFVARIAGVDNRTSAESLTNIELFLPRAHLPAAAEDEFYFADLIGLTALSMTRAPIGRVKDILDFGAGPILEITPAEGGETLLLPFAKAVVPEIDVAGGWILVVPPVEIEARDETEAAPREESPS